MPLKPMPLPALLMKPEEEPAAHGPLLQTLIVTCDGVEYMFFGPPVLIPGPDDFVPNVESLAFGGFIPIDHMVEFLKKASDPEKLKPAHVQ